MTKKEKRIAHLCIIVFALCICFLCWYNTSYATTDKQIVEKYVNKHYPEYSIQYVPYASGLIEKRTQLKDTVVVEKIKSVSTGKKDKRNKRYWGKIVNNKKYHCWYNKKVAKGKKVTQYLVYNPYTDYCDDVVLVVDNKKSR